MHGTIYGANVKPPQQLRTPRQPPRARLPAQQLHTSCNTCMHNTQAAVKEQCSTSCWPAQNWSCTLQDHPTPSAYTRRHQPTTTGPAANGGARKAATQRETCKQRCGPHTWLQHTCLQHATCMQCSDAAQHSTPQQTPRTQQTRAREAHISAAHTRGLSSTARGTQAQQMLSHNTLRGRQPATHYTTTCSSTNHRLDNHSPNCGCRTGCSVVKIHLCGPVQLLNAELHLCCTSAQASPQTTPHAIT